MNLAELKKISKSIRLQVLRVGFRSGKGHLGGTYSCVDLLVSLYYGDALKFNVWNPTHPDRDRFILSKGHACLALYPILLDLGFISQEKFNSYGHNGGLGSQLDVSISGVDYNTGSLGHSLGVCAGMALAAILDNKDYMAYTIIGDAECDTGSFWEAIKFAGQLQLSKLCCIIDRNRFSVTEEIEYDPLLDNPTMLRHFNWDFCEIDGHDFDEINNALQNARDTDKPTMIIANTIKGKGVSFMESSVKWHHSMPTEKEYKMAEKELLDG